MTTHSLPEIHFRYKFFFGILGIFLIGLILLIVGQNIAIDPDTREGTSMKLICEQLSTALLVGSITAGLYEYFLRAEFLKHTNQQTTTICDGISRLGTEAHGRAESIRDFFSANAEQRELGISHCFREVDRFDFADDIQDSRYLVAIMNDGRGWTGNYYQRFVNRFNNGDSETIVILMHPNSEAIALHAQKVGTTVAGIRMKIAETIRLIHRANNGQRPVKILGHYFYNTMSVFITESHAIMTPYFLSKVRRTPPVFTFIDSGIEGFYQKMKQDAEALMVDCVDISSYITEDGSPMNSQGEQGAGGNPAKPGASA